MKKLVGAAVFVATLAAALLITKYYSPQPAPAPAPPPPPGRVETSPPPLPPHATPPGVTFKVQLVTLDFATRKSHTTLVLERERSAPAPSRVWVWTAFFVPGEADGGRVFAGEPVELREPFDGGARASVNATGACPWRHERAAPASGYYARVYVSTESAAAARRADEEVSRDIQTATPVFVEQGPKRGR